MKRSSLTLSAVLCPLPSAHAQIVIPSTTIVDATNRLKTIEIQEPVWHQASTNAINATNRAAIIEAQEPTWHQAATNAINATNRAAIIEVQEPVWHQASTNAINATNRAAALEALTNTVAYSADATNRYWFEASGTFGGTGVYTQTWPFVAAAKPIGISILSVGDGVVTGAVWTNTYYSYSTSDTTNGFFYGPAGGMFVIQGFLKR